MVSSSGNALSMASLWHSATPHPRPQRTPIAGRWSFVDAVRLSGAVTPLSSNHVHPERNGGVAGAPPRADGHGPAAPGQHGRAPARAARPAGGGAGLRGV